MTTDDIDLPVAQSAPMAATSPVAPLPSPRRPQRGSAAARLRLWRDAPTPGAARAALGLTTLTSGEN